MSDIESTSVRLEDGEIGEESNESLPICASSPGGCIDGIPLQRSEDASNPADTAKYASPKASDNVGALQRDKGESLGPKKPPELASTSSKLVYLEDASDYADEDEMLCVRGASPPAFSWDKTRRIQTPQYESDSYSILPPKRRKPSKKGRHKKKTKSKKNSKERSASSSDDQHKSKPREALQSLPSHSQAKQKQLCKFYIQKCCAKGNDCEYMHSEFPCKFFYMGLECDDEVTRGRCKLSHGGTLPCEMLIALIRHIHTAPTDVLGVRFVELRSKMPAGEASKMVHDMQVKLQSPAREPESTTPKPDVDFVASLREKLYFLSEEQIDKLQSMCISKPEDLLCLTLAQLNAIGIHAIQIEAIQMSLIGGQDMDMRSMLPPTVQPVEVVELTKDVDCREVAVSNDVNWDEDEQPLVIDESENEDDDREKDKSDEDGDIIIDVVGSSPPTDFAQLSHSDDEKNGTEISFAVSEWNEDCEISVGVIPETTMNAGELEKVERNEMPQTVVERLDNDVPVEAKTDVFEYSAELQMEVDTSSENWDADEQQSMEQDVKKIETIDSPDCSDDEASRLFSSAPCPLLPSRTPNLENYTPALEIDAHLTYPAMDYKLHEIYLPEYEVNKPTQLDKLLKANSTDPRLQKFLEKEKNYGFLPQTDYSFFPRDMSQGDPRIRAACSNNSQIQNYNASPILYGYLQGSRWYQELKSNLKIQINHSVANLVRALNVFHKDPSPKKIFDLFQIECAGVLLEVMRNVGIFIDVNGNITEEKNYHQLCAHQQNTSQPYSIASGTPTQGCGGGGNQQPKPGLLGFAPPGIRYESPHMPPSSNEYSFARQAFGNQCFGNNNNGGYNPPGSGFYVGDRNFNCRRGPVNFEAATAFRKPQKRNLKRRL